MSKVYRVAIIGTGMICNAAHIPAYKAMGDKVKIVAVADIREEAAKETLSATIFPNIMWMLMRCWKKKSRTLSLSAPPTLTM